MKKFITTSELASMISELKQQIKDVEEPLNYDEAARFLKVSKSTLHNTRGQLPHHKAPSGAVYFYRSELNAWIKNDPIRNRLNKELTI